MENVSAGSAQAEIAELKARLQEAQERFDTLNARKDAETPAFPRPAKKSPPQTSLLPTAPPPNRPPNDIHPLLLLSDSALPLGSFAFSSGLESYLAHTPKPQHTHPPTFSRFLSLSLASLAGTTLPFVVAGWSHPADLADADNDLDAALMCVVARRASVQQGRALLGVWERSFVQCHALPAEDFSDAQAAAREALMTFGKAVKSAPLRGEHAVLAFESVLRPNGHLPPLFGAVCRALGIGLEQCLYVYLLNHAKTLVSAGIRAGMMGPYAAQGVLASEGLRGIVWGLVRAEMAAGRGTGEAGQSVPAIDLWQGRHEIIYSRIFNS